MMSVWAELLETAIHAPSPHNVQPWRVRINSDHEADLFIDSTRTLPKEDPTGSFIILTMGLFIEALSLFAAEKHYRVEYELHHEPEWYPKEILTATQQTFLPFARLRLTYDENVTPLGFNWAIFRKRRTSRISLKPASVSDEATASLRDVAAQWGQRYDQITDATLIERMLELDTRALFHDLNSPDYHDEITSWFRFTDYSSQKHRDGLDYRCMNASRLTYWMTARFPQMLLIPGLRSLFARKYRAQTGIVPTIGILAGDFWEPASAIRTGRFLMRFWLETTRYNLYIHPYGNLVTNKSAAQWMLNETKISNIWLVFKIGYSDEPPKSYRRSVEEILLD